MAVTIRNIIKWAKMLSGKSVLHVNQDIGSLFEVGELCGYFNDMTEKVLMEPYLLDNEQLPQVVTEKGEKIFFPVAIFQYGLGVYDLYLKTNENKYLLKFEQCCQWALNNQNEDGSWNNFFYIYPEHPYGAMCQGEGISLLVRGNKVFKDERYLVASNKAYSFMTKDINNGGTSFYKNSDIILLEYTHLPAVLNGWIFSIIGIYDYWLATGNPDIKLLFDKAINSLITYLPQFNDRFWSKYDLSGRITSPFYHNLQIAQMKALYEITNEPIFGEYEKTWRKEQDNRLCVLRAFMIKALQKIRE